MSGDRLYNGHKVFFTYRKWYGSELHLATDWVFVEGNSPVTALNSANATLKLWAKDEDWMDWNASHVAAVGAYDYPPYGDLQRLIVEDLNQLGYH